MKPIHKRLTFAEINVIEWAKDFVLAKRMQSHDPDNLCAIPYSFMADDDFLELDHAIQRLCHTNNEWYNYHDHDVVGRYRDMSKKERRRLCTHPEDML